MTQKPLLWCRFGCGHTSYELRSIKEHERQCRFNPAMRACESCLYHENYEGCSKGYPDNQRKCLKWRAR